MPGGATGLILLLLFVAYHVITQIMQAIQRKHEQEKAAELARQKQRGTGTSRGDSGIKESEPVARSRLDELAARRQAQLEELRMRREAQAGRSPAQVRTGSQGASRTTPQRTSQPTQQSSGQPRQQRDVFVPRASRQTPAEAAAARQAAERAAREAEQRQVRMAQQQREVQAKQLAEVEALAARRRARAAKRVEEEADLVSPYALRVAPELAVVRRMLNEPDMLRQAILLKEILDRPISLRPQEQMPGFNPAA